MSACETFNSALRLLHDRELQSFQNMFEAGSRVAVAGALHYCAEHGVPVPRWLVIASRDVVCDLLKRERSTKRAAPPRQWRGIARI